MQWRYFSPWGFWDNLLVYDHSHFYLQLQFTLSGESLPDSLPDSPRVGTLSSASGVLAVICSWGVSLGGGFKWSTMPGGSDITSRVPAIFSPSPRLTISIPHPYPETEAKQTLKLGGGSFAVYTVWSGSHVWDELFQLFVTAKFWTRNILHAAWAHGAAQNMKRSGPSGRKGNRSIEWCKILEILWVVFLHAFHS